MTDSSAKFISAFSFLDAPNSALSADVTATLSGTTISATVPLGSSVTALIATFTTTGSSVKIGSTTQTSGTTAHDFSSPVTYTVIAADGSTQNYTVTVTVAADATAPTSPTVTINSNASSTTSTSVTLNLSASDGVGVTAYYASETNSTPSASDNGWTSVTSATSYSANGSFTLSSGTGTKTVYVWFKDAAGNVSASASDSISYGDITTGLLAYYPLSGNANDTSGNGLHGTVTGATLTTDRNGNTNSAYSFDGDDIINLGNNFNIDSGDWSFSIWAKSNTASGYYTAFGKQLTNDPWYGYYLNVIDAGSGTIAFIMGTTGGPIQLNSSIANSTSWRHIVVTLESNLVKMYVDGVKQTNEATKTNTTNDTRPFVLGGTRLEAPNFNGVLDEFRVYNRALSLTEVQAIYNSN